MSLTASDDDRLFRPASSSMAKKATHVLIHLVFLFPYMLLFPFGHPAGVQIQVVLVAAGVVLYWALRDRIALNALLVPIIAAPLIGVFWPSAMGDFVRSIGIYLTMYGAYVYFERAIRSGIPIIRMLEVALVVAFAAASAQVLFGPAVLDPIVHARTSEARGMTSLFVEPSFYGIWVAMLTLVVCVFERRALMRSGFFLLALVQVGLLSQSSIAILFGLLATVLYLLLVRGRWILITGLIVLAIGAMPAFTLLPEDSRAYQVLSGLLADPLSIILMDVSIGLRISHVVLPLWGAAENLFVPHGFSAFEAFQEEIAGRWIFLLQPSDRIMSGYGSALFEIGFFALAILYVNFRYLGQSRCQRGVGRLALTAIALTLLAMYVNAISFALPLFPLVAAIVNNSQPVIDSRRSATLG